MANTTEIITRPAGAAVLHTERLVALRGFPGMEDLSLGELSSLADNVTERFIPQGTVIFEEGEPLTRFMLVIAGRVRTERHGHPMQTVGPHETVGALAAFARNPDGLKAITLTDTYVFEVRLDTMFELLEDNFNLLAGLMRRLGGQVIEARKIAGTGAGFRSDVPDVAPPERELDFVEKLLYLHGNFVLMSSRIEALSDLAREVEEVRLPVGPLWSEGDHGGYMLMMISGEISCETGAGQRFHFLSGDAVGALDATAAAPRWFSAAVTKPVVALRVNMDAVLDVLEDNPDIAVHMVSGFANGIDELYEKLAGHEINTLS